MNLRHFCSFLLTAVLVPLAGCRTSPAPASPDASFPPSDAVLSPAELQADLGQLYRTLQAAHYDLYARRTREEYDARFHELRASFDTPIGRLEARRELQRFVAFGNVAHARIDPPLAEWDAFRAAGGLAFPLSVTVEAGRVRVRRDYSGIEGVEVGDELISVGTVPALEWLAPYRSLVSGDNDYLAYTQLETLLPLLVWWQDGVAEHFDVVLDSPGRGIRSLRLPARSREQFSAAEAAARGASGPDRDAREARMLADGIAYLRPGPFYDNRPEAEHPWDPAAFRVFIDAAFTQFLEQDARALLIDLRDNPGGDNSFSDLMLAWFADEPFRFSPEFDIRVSEAAIASNAARLASSGAQQDSTSARLAAAYAASRPGERVSFPIALVPPRDPPRFERPVYLLVNRRSYSNTVMVAATVQDYGFGVVLGEETADLASTFGAGETFTLQASGFEVFFPKARILRPSRDPAARGVVPDVPIAAPPGADGGDAVLEEALRILAARGREGARR